MQRDVLNQTTSILEIDLNNYALAGDLTFRRILQRRRGATRAAGCGGFACAYTTRTISPKQRCIRCSRKIVPRTKRSVVLRGEPNKIYGGQVMLCGSKSTCTQNARRENKRVGERMISTDGLWEGGGVVR